MRLLWSTLVLFLLPALAGAAPPRINTVFPPAVQRGVETRLQFVGTGLAAAPKLVLPFMGEQRGTGPNQGSIKSTPVSFADESASFSIALPADTPPGVYPVRVRTSEGISNLRLIAVTDLPVIQAKEPNGRYQHGKLDLEQAQRVEWPCVIAGGRLSRDIDAFCFAVKAGQRLTFVTETRRLGLTPDPVLRLWDASGRMLAYRHDTPGLERDERLDFRFEKAGEYFVELQSEGVAGWNNHYLLKIGPFDYARAVFPLGGRRGDVVRFEVINRDGKSATVEVRVPADPWLDHWHLPLTDLSGSLPWRLASGDLPEVVEHADRTEPQKITWPATVNGRIGQPGEADLYRIAVKPGQQVRVQVEAYHLGSSLDGHLMVYDPAGMKLLAANDDQAKTGLLDPALDFLVPQGVEEAVVCLRHCSGSGGVEHGYRLTIERGGPDFYLWLGKAQNARKQNEENESWFRMDGSDTLNLPIGQETRLRISARRDANEVDPRYTGPIQGYQGPIHLKAVDVPAGVTIRPAVIPAGKTEGELVCLASAQAPKKPFAIVILGEANRDDGTVIRRVAERKLFIADPQMFHLAWNWRIQKVVCVTCDKP